MGDEFGIEMRNFMEKENLVFEDVIYSEDYKEEVEKKKRWRINCWLEYMLGIGIEMKEGMVESKEYKRKEGVDFVFVLRFYGWLKVVNVWIKRDCKWFFFEMVDKVI